MFTKFEPGVFLEKAELDRFRKSLDEKGFRQFLLNNTLKFGLVDKQYFNDTNTVVNSFTNGLVYETADLTISHNEVEAIDVNGLTVYRKATTNISVPADSQWYWVKIKHQYTSKELGTFSIDAKGNLVGDVTSELLTILRGQPYFPSKVSFLGSTLNTLEYDVLEVVDDSNAILQGFFTPETDVSLSVTGTFAPDVTPTEDQKNIFQYDDSIFSLVQEVSVNTPPTKIEGEEFYLARIKNDGVALTIQDKRTERWETKANFYLNNVDKTVNNLLGVESIRFDHPNSTKDYNALDIAWGMKSENWSVNTKLNQVTLSSGIGGRYKDVSYVNTGDFDGWLLYWEDGSFSNIISSTQSGSQINLVLDTLDIDKVSTDGGTTITPGKLLVVPNAEEIEIELIPWNDSATVVAEPTDQPEVTRQVYSFPIADQKGLCRVLAYADTCQYGVRYRYRKNNEYSASMNMLADVNYGHYTEKAYDDDGYLLAAVIAATYASNILNEYIKTYDEYQVLIQLKSDAYINKINSIDLGDLLGVETVVISASPNDISLTVGDSRQYQYISGSQFTLNTDKRIILADGLRNGNFFIIHLKQVLLLGGNTFTIVNSALSTLRDFTQIDMDFLQNSPEGILLRCTWDGTMWILSSLNERTGVDPAIVSAWDVTVTGTTTSIRYLTDFIGGLSSSFTSLSAESYDRTINLSTSGTDPDTLDVSVTVESGIGTGVYNRVVRNTGYGGGMAIIPAGCRFVMTFNRASGSGTMECTYVLRKFRL